MASKLVRFGVSLEEELLIQFDRLIKQRNYTNRSEALRDMIREELVKKEWTENKVVTGMITMVYDHHNCFEIIATRGNSKDIEELYRKLKSIKSVKHAGFMMATKGNALA